MNLNPFRAKAAPKREPTEAPVHSQVMYLQSGIGVAVVPWGAACAAEAAMKHPIVYRALDKLASSVQQVRWYAAEDPHATPAERRGKSTTIRDLQALLDSPNDDLTPEMLRYWMTLNYACYGRVPLKVGMSAMFENKANAIYPLEARHVKTILNERGTPRRYEYGDGEDKQEYTARAAWKPGTSGGYVDQIWKPGLKGYQHHRESNNPLAAIGLPAQVITTLLQRAIQTAQGHPNVRYMVTCERTLTVEQKATLKRYLDDHAPDGAEAGNIPVLQNAGRIEIHKLDNDLSDIHSKMPSDDMQRLIFGAFGIPIALGGIGGADGAKYASNYGESRKTFWEDTVIPAYVSPLFQGISRMLCPAGVIIAADYDSIPALSAGRLGEMKTAADVDFLTVDEKRAMFGYSPNANISTGGDNEPSTSD